MLLASQTSASCAGGLAVHAHLAIHHSASHHGSSDRHTESTTASPNVIIIRWAPAGGKQILYGCDQRSRWKCLHVNSSRRPWPQVLFPITSPAQPKLVCRPSVPSCRAASRQQTTSCEKHEHFTSESVQLWSRSRLASAALRRLGRGSQRPRMLNLQHMQQCPTLEAVKQL